MDSCVTERKVRYAVSVFLHFMNSHESRKVQGKLVQVKKQSRGGGIEKGMNTVMFSFNFSP